MSKKSFLKADWKEILILLLIDFGMLGSFAYLNISGCYNQQNVIVISPQIICTLQFFWNIWNLVEIFAAVIIVNFALSGYWHFVVKK